MHLADNFLTTTVGIKNLREEGPERILFAECSPPTEVALRLVPEFLDWDEATKTIAQLTDRVPANSTPFLGQLLSARSRLAAQRGEVKSGQKKGIAFHARLSH